MLNQKHRQALRCHKKSDGPTEYWRPRLSRGEHVKNIVTCAENLYQNEGKAGCIDRAKWRKGPAGAGPLFPTVAYPKSDYKTSFSHGKLYRALLKNSLTKNILFAMLMAFLIPDGQMWSTTVES